MFFSIRLKRFLFLPLLVLAAVSVLTFTGISIGRSVAVSAEGKEGVPVPVIMYHSILRDPKMQGDYVISPELLEQDLKYLQSHGYTGIVMQDLLGYVQNGTPLPEKPVLLTFDDGYYNNYFYAYPLAKQYQFKILISPVGFFTQRFSDTDDPNPYYAHITWDNIREMEQSGYVEFQNHSYNLHAQSPRKGAKRKSGESVEEYQQMLKEDLSKMQQAMQEHTGILPTTFVYPFGAVSKEAEPVLRELGFQATLVCESRTNFITRDPDCLFALGRYLRPAGVSSEAYFTKLGIQ